MRVAPEGLPFAAGAFALCALAAGAALALHCPRLAAALLALAFVGAGFMAFFFRDPERAGPDDADALVSGADGVVNSIAFMREDVFLKRDAVRITVFLNLPDVHVNRAPMAGTVETVAYTPGRFLAAYKENASFENAFSTIGVRGEKTDCLVRQIVGLVVRRVVTRAKAGDVLGRGERIGLMKFGSRLDVFFPAADVEVAVKKGDRVRAGETVVARLRK
ncbi:MAG: phosphatidylserine decarboxylase [Kiritimatiellaeota bacterium]|nr:phosphatidylserine decarboxylase [Kiritimatiellota bacterium]